MTARAAGASALLAALLAAGLAGAAERPAPAPTAEACPGHGPGFVRIPGSATCVRIAGRVRAEAGTSSRRIGRDDVVGLGSSGQVSADTRTDTDYGPVRSFVRVRAGSGPR